MRIAILAAAVSMALVGLSVADETRAAIGQDTNIPQQDLGPALRALAKERNLQVLFRSELVRDVRTTGAVGVLTTDEALSRLLSGTTLTFQYLSEDTVTIVSATDAGRTNATSDGSRRSDIKGGQRSFWDRFRLAQVDQGRMAQEAVANSAALPESADRTGIEEIIVTAQKREERLQDVPFAITAVGQQEIRDRGAVDIKDLQYSVPGLNIQELSPGANKTTMRGINPGTGTGLPIVGIYVDEVGISPDQQQRDGAFPLVDIERIEVLRGPQGTLYGQGSIAGTIRYLTRNPDLDRTDGFVGATAQSQEDGDMGYRVNGAFGVPLVIDRVGLRVSGGYDQLAGWIDYPDAGIEDANESQRVFVRPKLYAKLTDQLDLTLMYQYYDQTSDTEASSSITSATSRPGRAILYPGSDRSQLASAILSWDLGPVTLLSATGYQDRKLHFQTPIATFLFDAPATYEQLTEELRVSSNGEAPLQYTVGIWYRHFSSNVFRRFFTANGAEVVALRRLGDDPVDSESKAVFGDVTMPVGERLSVSLGARYYDDERSNNSVTPPVSGRHADFSSFSPRGSARFSWTPDVSTYATVSKGFRSGGFNNSGTTFGPESLWNYEIGTKAGLLARRLFIDVAAYYLDYEDRQTVSAVETSPGVFFSETRNTGKASGVGVEGAIGAQLIAGLRLDLTASYNDVTADVTNSEVVEGERFDFVPAFTGSVAFSQRLPFGATLSGMWRIDYLYSDSYASIIRQALANGSVLTLQDFQTKSQGYLNARAGIENDRWSVYLDAQNILNEDAVLFPFGPVSTTNEGVHARPRSYGVTLRYNF